MSLCNNCGSNLCNNCGNCGQCQPKKCCNKCPKRCGCPEGILSIEPDSNNPTLLRFNLGGRSVLYDFDSVVKAGETCTTLYTDITARNLIYNAECKNNILHATELGAILHLADIGDVDASTIKDNAILVYRKDKNCAENCDGKNGWIGVDPSEAGDTSLDYIMGSAADGEVKSLMPPSNSNQFYYLSWAAQGKASWTQPRVVSTPPVDADGKKWAVYMDPTTHELVVVKENA